MPDTQDSTPGPENESSFLSGQGSPDSRSSSHASRLPPVVSAPATATQAIHADSQDAIVYLHLFSGEQQRIFNNA